VGLQLAKLSLEVSATVRGGCPGHALENATNGLSSPGAC
jgi:hypothetical protein